VYEEQLEKLTGSLFWLPNLFAYLRAWSSYARVELKLGVYEQYLLWRARFGWEPVV
jgi:aarF domain-containing kinase